MGFLLKRRNNYLSDHRRTNYMYVHTRLSPRTVQSRSIIEGVLVKPEMQAEKASLGDAGLPCLVKKHPQASGCRDYILSALATSPGTPPTPDHHLTKVSPGKQLTDITSHPSINQSIIACYLPVPSSLPHTPSPPSPSLSTPRIPSAFPPSHPSH